MITFQKNYVVTRTIEETLSEFVHQYLVEVRPYEDEYDFFIRSSNDGFITRAFSLDQSKCNISDLEDKEAILKGLAEYVEKYGEIK